MFTHVMVGANDPDTSIAFYDAALGALGIKGQRMGDRAFYGSMGGSGAFAVGRPKLLRDVFAEEQAERLTDVYCFVFARHLQSVAPPSTTVHWPV